MVKYFTKPIFIASIICIFIFYSGLFVKPEAGKVYSLIPQNQINIIHGQIISSPAKSSSGKTYSVKFNVYETESETGFKSSAKNVITAFIPSEIVEAYYPGKLYSSAKNGAYLYEAGGIYTFEGKFIENNFLVKNCIYSKWPNGITGKIDRFRAFCRLQFKRLMYAWKEAGGLLLALLSGSREYTEKITAESFKNAGLSHILALSGMHLSMFSSIAVYFGNLLKNKKISYLLKSVTLIIFIWFAGFSPSLLRAFICSMLLLAASIVSSEKPDMIIVLCFSFILQCVISPSDLTNAGFILSYTALAGILLTSEFFRSFTDFILPKYTSASFSASLGAQTFTIPVSLKLFGSFAPIGIIATTIISPLITIFIYSGLILIVLSLLFPFLAEYSGIFINFLYTIIKKLVIYFSHCPRIII